MIHRLDSRSAATSAVGPMVPSSEGPSLLALAAIVGGAFMSINFWFAAGWLSVSPDGLNLPMFLTQVVLTERWT